jgi:hypothetical protein
MTPVVICVCAGAAEAESATREKMKATLTKASGDFVWVGGRIFFSSSTVEFVDCRSRLNGPRVRRARDPRRTRSPAFQLVGLKCEEGVGKDD